MGENDPPQEWGAWSAVDDRLGPLVRWVEGDAHVRLDVPTDATWRPDRERIEVAWLRVHFGHGLIRRIGVNALPSEGYAEQREVPVVVGCSLLIVADALRQVGAFDEAYFAYHEGVRDAGWEVHYQALSRVYHAGSRSTAGLVRQLTRSRDRGGLTLPHARELTWNPLRSYRMGRTGELIEHCRGLWDGLWSRPVDLRRLGLRP